MPENMFCFVSTNAMATRILIINGPNLNLLGKRQPEVYGSNSFEEYFNDLTSRFPEAELAYYQSNIEGELIDEIQKADQNFDGILLNAGGYSHTSVAIRDAISAIETDVLEIHISNIFKREEFRHGSMIAAVCKGSISGFGLDSYRLGVEAVIESKN